MNRSKSLALGLFASWGLMPSVDRRAMKTSLDASKQSPTDGLLRLIAQEVRAIHLSQVVRGKPTAQMHVIDVVHRPIDQGNPENLPVNEAHSQIEAIPALGDARFKKLKEALARIAEKHGWLAAPS